MTEKRTWLILGGTSAVGRSFARAVAKNGHDVFFLGKDENDLQLAAEDIRVRYPDVCVNIKELDTSNPDSFVKTLEACETDAKNIISVFSALETAYSQKECGKDLGKIKNMFQINYFAQIYFMTAVAPILIKQGCGEVIVLGSTAGEYGTEDNYAYGSTKAALHVWMQGFHDQMKQNGITVTIVKIDNLGTVGEKRSLSFWTPIDLDACAERCLEYSAQKAYMRYFPWYSGLTVLLRRIIPADILRRLER